jgi:hypothetical protein
MGVALRSVPVVLRFCSRGGALICSPAQRHAVHARACFRKDDGEPRVVSTHILEEHGIRGSRVNIGRVHGCERHEEEFDQHRLVLFQFPEQYLAVASKFIPSGVMLLCV